MYSILRKIVVSQENVENSSTIKRASQQIEVKIENLQMIQICSHFVGLTGSLRITRSSIVQAGA